MPDRMRDLGERRYCIPCQVGCLRHVIGVTYFEWNRPHDPDEPELYFETLHEPYESVWKRLYRAWQFVVRKEPMGADSTLVGAHEARRLAVILTDYADEYDKWAESMRARVPDRQLTGE